MEITYCSLCGHGGPKLLILNNGLCMPCNEANHMAKAHDEYMLQKDHDELISLCKQLLKGVDICSHGPHYIVQPFLGIVIEHAELIHRLNLTE